MSEPTSRVKIHPGFTRGTRGMFCRQRQRSIFVVVENHHQLVCLSLICRCIELDLVAELAFKDGWLEGGAKRKGDVFQPHWRLRDDQVRLVGAEGDQRRWNFEASFSSQMRRMACLSKDLTFSKTNQRYLHF